MERFPCIISRLIQFPAGGPAQLLHRLSASLPSSDAVSVNVLKVVKMFLQSLGRARLPPLRFERQTSGVAGRGRAEAAKTARSEAGSALRRGEVW